MIRKYFHAFYWKRLYLKVVKHEGTPTSIARGVALGLLVGLVIPIGFQTLIALFLAFLLKANKVLTWFATCITNPVSVIFIYPVQCYLGGILIFRPIRYERLQGTFHYLAEAETWEEAYESFSGLGTDIVLSFFAGGFLFAVIAVPIGYIVSYKLVEAYRKLKEIKRKRCQEKFAADRRAAQNSGRDA